MHDPLIPLSTPPKSTRLALQLFLFYSNGESNNTCVQKRQTGGKIVSSGQRFLDWIAVTKLLLWIFTKSAEWKAKFKVLALKTNHYRDPCNIKLCLHHFQCLICNCFKMKPYCIYSCVTHFNHCALTVLKHLTQVDCFELRWKFNTQCSHRVVTKLFFKVCRMIRSRRGLILCNVLKYKW